MYEILLISIFACIGIIIAMLVAIIKLNEKFRNFSNIKEEITEFKEKVKSHVDLTQEFVQISNDLTTSVTGFKEDITSSVTNFKDNIVDSQNSVKKTFDQFINYIKLDAAFKGGFGQKIVRMIMETLPEDKLWAEQFNATWGKNGKSSGLIDFVFKLPPKDTIIPIDSKFNLPKDILEENGETEILFFNKKQKSIIQKLLIKEADEIAGYISPANNTTDFALMFVPDAVFFTMDETTFMKIAEKHVIPTNTSGLLAIILLIQNFNSMWKISEFTQTSENLNALVGEIKKFLKNLKKALKVIIGHHGREGKQLNKLNKKITRLTKEISNIFDLLNVDKLLIAEIDEIGN